MTDPLRLALLPRAVWVWTAPAPDGKRVQVWVDAQGQPIDYDVDVSDLEEPLPPDLEFDFRPIAVPRVATPTMERVALAALLVQCRM